VSKRPISLALQNVDLNQLGDAVSANVVFNSPILATAADEVSGREVLQQIIGTAIRGFGPPQDVTEYHGADGRYVVTFHGQMQGQRLECAMTMTENAEGKVIDINTHLRPYPVVTWFREHMHTHLCPSPVPDAIWALPATV